MIENMYEVLFRRFQDEFVELLVEQAHGDDRRIQYLTNHELIEPLIEDLVDYVIYALPVKIVMIQFIYNQSDKRMN